MNIKTIVFLNLRFSDFYSKNLFSELKKNKNLRLVAILDQHFKKRIPKHVSPYLDETYHLHCEPKDGFLAEFAIEDLRKIIKKEMSQTQELRIVCTDEFNLLNAGQLRREFVLAGHNDDELIKFRDKAKMKELVQKSGLRTPKFKLIHSEVSYAQLIQELGAPFIIKPVDSCGSHGVEIINNENEFIKVKNSKYAFEAEEFIQGTLYHVDSFIRDHKIIFMCANEYSFPNLDYTKGKPLASIPLPSNDPLSVKLIEFAIGCLQALGANNIVNHMELFVTKNNEIIFLEVSGRPPGVLLNLTHEINFGINLMDADFFMQAGEEIFLEKDKSSQKAFATIFPLLPGKVMELVEPKVLSRYDITWFTEIDNVVEKKDCQNIVNKACHAIFYNTDMRLLRKDFERIKSQVALRCAS